MHGRTVRRPFMAGMAQRVTERLEEMRAAREAATKAATDGTGRALVVQVKREITTERFQRYAETRALDLGNVHRGRVLPHQGAVAVGMAAGNRVALAPSVTGADKKLRRG